MFIKYWKQILILYIIYIIGNLFSVTIDGREWPYTFNDASETILITPIILIFLYWSFHIINYIRRMSMALLKMMENKAKLNP